MSHIHSKNRAITTDGGAYPLTRLPAHPLMWLVVLALALGLAFVPFRLLLALIGGGVVTLLALAQPVWGLYAAVLAVPVQTAFQLPGGLSYTQAAFTLVTGAWILRVLAHPERRIVTNPLVWAWCFLLWALLLSTALTPYSTNEAAKETLRWTQAFLIWLIAVTTIQKRWHVIGLIACLLVAPASEALFGLYQFATGDGPPSFRIAANLPFVRAYGTHGQPNSFAGYMNMAWPLALALATYNLRSTIYGWKLRTRQFPIPNSRFFILHSQLSILNSSCSMLVVLVLVAALAASFSRGAWLGALCGLLGMALALGRPGRYGVLALVALVALLLVASNVGMLPGAFATRITSITDSFSYVDPSTVQVTPANFAKVERMAHIQAGLRMVAEHPLTGVGPGNYSVAYQDVAVAPWYVSRGHAHNYYLHIAAEAGLLGLLAYLLLVGGVAFQAWTLVRRTQSAFWRSVGVGCCGIIAAVAGHSLFENLHVLSMGIQLAAVWALVGRGLRSEYSVN